MKTSSIFTWSGFMMLLSMTTEAMPISGEYLSVTENPDSVCMVSFHELDYIHRCSATLVDDTHVVLASHCFPSGTSKSSVRVSCGSQDSKIKVRAQELFFDARVQTIAHQISTRATSSEKPTRLDWEYLRANDIAIIKLKKPIPHPPMSTIQNFESMKKEFFTIDEAGRVFLKDEAECRFSGYGVDNTQNIGTLHTAQLDLKIADYQLEMLDDGSGPLLVYYPKKIVLNREAGSAYAANEEDLLSIKTPLSMVENADSGGPLFCRLPEKDWTLIAVISGPKEIPFSEKTILSLEFSVLGSVTYEKLKAKAYENY
jgi:hypothetical protein